MSAQSISTAPAAATIHPRWVRICHWINALAILVMIGSGWQIYNASPLFDFHLPAPDHARQLARRRVAMALRCHVGAGHQRPRLSSRSALSPAASAASCCRSRPREVIADIKAALTFKLAHDDLSTLQRRAEAALCRRHTCRRRHRAVRPVDLEAGAVPGTDGTVRRLRRRPLRAFLRHGGDRRLSRRACVAGADRAEEPARDERDDRSITCASEKSFPASIRSC